MWKSQVDIFKIVFSHSLSLALSLCFSFLSGRVSFFGRRSKKSFDVYIFDIFKSGRSHTQIKISKLFLNHFFVPILKSSKYHEEFAWVGKLGPATFKWLFHAQNQSKTRQSTLILSIYIPKLFDSHCINNTAHIFMIVRFSKDNSASFRCGDTINKVVKLSDKHHYVDRWEKTLPDYHLACIKLFFFYLY